jgi:amidophosphoribosyltransferase
MPPTAPRLDGSHEVTMDELQHECGIAALYHLNDVPPSPLLQSVKPKHTSRLMPRLLLDLQNRGQLAAGFSTFNPDRDEILDTYREIGTVIEAFKLNHRKKYDNIMAEFDGRAAIGHVRYATSGPTTRKYAQPFERHHGCTWKWFALGFNGQLANFPAIRAELLSKEDYHLTRNNDTEVIMHWIARAMSGDERPNLVDLFSAMSEKFDGAYNLVYLNAAGEMVVLRDPLGIRPLCWAFDGSLFAAASESVALLNLGFRDIKSLEPGEMIVVQNNVVKVKRYAKKRPPAHCFFEWIYFANVASTLDGRSVYLSRSDLGRELAQQERALNRVPIDDDTIIVPVPDTGKAAADAMAYELKLRSAEGLIRNRYVGRTFIEGTNRADRVRLKFTPLREVLEGKRVLLIEDSIVRSTTLKTLLSHLRDVGGAREVHVRVACPPIVAPCFYGIDMSTVKELFAPRYISGPMPTEAEQDQMASDLKADSLRYLPLDAVARCIQIPEQHLCRACITGNYPTPAGQELFELDRRFTPTGGGRLVELGMVRR